MDAYLVIHRCHGSISFEQLTNAAHESHRFLGVGSMHLFDANRTAPLLTLPEVSRYSILTGSPQRIVPPRTTAAYTPTLTWLCWAAVRRIPGSLGRFPCARVVITQRPQGTVIFRRTAVPMASVWPIQAFSAKPFSPEASCTTMFGRNRRTSNRPCGYSSRRRSSVAVVK